MKLDNIAAAVDSIILGSIAKHSVFNLLSVVSSLRRILARTPLLCESAM